MESLHKYKKVEKIVLTDEMLNFLNTFTRTINHIEIHIKIRISVIQFQSE